MLYGWIIAVYGVGNFSGCEKNDGKQLSACGKPSEYHGKPGFGKSPSSYVSIHPGGFP